MDNGTPDLRLTLAPHGRDDTGFVDYLDVSIQVQALNKKAGDTLFTIASKTVTIPFCELDGALAVSDDAGPVAYTAEQQVDGFLDTRRYVAGRDVQGDLRVAYRILPRVQPDDYRSSPYFDLVSEEGGVNGAV